MTPIILGVLCLTAAIWTTLRRPRWTPARITRRDYRTFRRQIESCQDVVAAAKEGR